METSSETVASTIDIISHGVQYFIGDFVYVKPPVSPTNKKPRRKIVMLERTWVTSEGEQMVRCVSYYRPMETSHKPTRKFFQKEVFQTDDTTIFLLSDIIGKCYVLGVKNYLNMRLEGPEPIAEKDVYVCEYRYSDKYRFFKKINAGSLNLSDHVKLIERSDPLEMNRVDGAETLSDEEEETVFKGDTSLSNEGSEKDINTEKKRKRQESGSKKSEQKDPEDSNLGSDCVKTSSETVASTIDIISKGVHYFIGDFVYVKPPVSPTNKKPRKKIVMLEQTWVTSEGEQMVRCVSYFRPMETSHKPTRKFFQKEVFQTDETTIFLLSDVKYARNIIDIIGKCYVLGVNNYLNKRLEGPEPIAEKDVYVCEYRYSDKFRYFKKINAGSLNLNDHVKLIERSDPLEVNRVDGTETLSDEEEEKAFEGVTSSSNEGSEKGIITEKKRKRQESGSKKSKCDDGSSEQKDSEDSNFGSDGDKDFVEEEGNKTRARKITRRTRSTDQNEDEVEDSGDSYFLEESVDKQNPKRKFWTTELLHAFLNTLLIHQEELLEANTKSEKEELFGTIAQELKHKQRGITAKRCMEKWSHLYYVQMNYYRSKFDGAREPDFFNEVEQILKKLKTSNNKEVKVQTSQNEVKLPSLANSAQSKALLLPPEPQFSPPVTEVIDESDDDDAPQFSPPVTLERAHQDPLLSSEGTLRTLPLSSLIESSSSSGKAGLSDSQLNTSIPPHVIPPRYHTPHSHPNNTETVGQDISKNSKKPLSLPQESQYSHPVISLPSPPQFSPPVIIERGQRDPLFSSERTLRTVPLSSLILPPDSRSDAGSRNSSNSLPQPTSLMPSQHLTPSQFYASLPAAVSQSHILHSHPDDMDTAGQGRDLTKNLQNRESRPKTIIETISENVTGICDIYKMQLELYKEEIELRRRSTKALERQAKIQEQQLKEERRHRERFVVLMENHGNHNNEKALNNGEV